MTLSPPAGGGIENGSFSLGEGEGWGEGETSSGMVTGRMDWSRVVC